MKNNKQVRNFAEVRNFAWHRLRSFSFFIL